MNSLADKARQRIIETFKSNPNQRKKNYGNQGFKISYLYISIVIKKDECLFELEFSFRKPDKE